MDNLRNWFWKQWGSIKERLENMGKVWEKPWALEAVIYVTLFTVASLIIISWPDFPDWTGLDYRSAWDFVGLLIIPVALAIIGYYFSKTLKDNELKIAQDDREEDALQNYFDKMTELILWYDLRTAPKEGKEDVHNLARARTLSILRSFKGSEAAVHKRSVLEFLHESELIQGENPIVYLDGADLFEADLFEVNLSEANLSGANLRGARLFRPN